MNIQRILAFDTQGHAAKADQLNLADLQGQYGVRIVGTNMYYGMIEPNLSLPNSQGLQGSARTFILDLISAMPAGGSATIDLGLEPDNRDNNSGSPATRLARVATDPQLDLIERLARELGELQDTAAMMGKELRIVIRFASEMNGGNRYSGAPRAFTDAYKSVAARLRTNRRLLLNFAPFVFADAHPDHFADYWPGDSLVDVVGCTWYVGHNINLPGAKANLDLYFHNFSSRGKPFCISELGGAVDRDVSGDTGVFSKMVRHLVDLPIDAPLDHVTLFLEQPWGVKVNVDQVLRVAP
jgi:hypothetical protein